MVGVTVGVNVMVGVTVMVGERVSEAVAVAGCELWRVIRGVTQSP